MPFEVSSLVFAGYSSIDDVRFLWLLLLLLCVVKDALKVGGAMLLGFFGLLTIANLLWPFLLFGLWRAIRPELPEKRVRA